MHPALFRRRTLVLLTTAAAAAAVTTTRNNLITSYSVAAMSSTSTNSSTKKGALIFLHGLGDTPAGWSSLEYQLPKLQPNLSNIEYVFPHAPTIPITINGGARMPGWFDLYDWPIGVGAQDDKKNKMAGVQIIESAITKLEKDHGIERHKIVIGGFSQGGAIALLHAYHPESPSNKNTQGGQKPPLAGCAALSAWLTLTDDLKKGDNGNIPLFWAHGQYDDKVLFEQQAFGIKTLKENVGVKSIDERQYAMGHQSDPDEIVALANFVNKSIFGGDKDEL